MMRCTDIYAQRMNGKSQIAQAEKNFNVPVTKNLNVGVSMCLIYRRRHSERKLGTCVE
jgi:hypothetical protein